MKTEIVASIKDLLMIWSHWPMRRLSLKRLELMLQINERVALETAPCITTSSTATHPMSASTRQKLLNHMMDGLVVDLRFNPCLGQLFFGLHNVPRDRCHLRTLSALVTLLAIRALRSWKEKKLMARGSWT